MNGTVEGVFHAAISVSSMDEAVRYYRDLLGLKVTFDDYHDPAAIAQLFGYQEPRVHSVVVSCPDGSEIELVEFERPRGRPLVEREAADAGILSLNLRVTGIEAIIDRLVAGGYEPSSTIVPQTLPDGGVLKVAVCRAPDGVAIILVELPPGRGSLAA
jgi:catechol 2,3-dioxygenase-like lactoylglutathione lyase family enzyme